MQPNLPYGTQWIDESDIAAAIENLRSPWLTQGPAVEKFEKAVAEFCGARYAVAVSNGTAALHIACLAAGLQPGQTLLTSPITFVASANCGLYCGAKVKFADVESEVPLMSPRALQAVGERLAIIIPVHYAGYVCDMEEIRKLASGFGSTVIEDACHALGSSWFDAGGTEHKVGSCSHSEMTVFSFHPVKHITTAEGGMITTNSPELYEKLKRLRSHGIHRPGPETGAEPWYYEMVDVGYNYRITDLQCAIGASQIRRLSDWKKRRTEIVEQYRCELDGLRNYRMLPSIPRQEPNYHLAVIRARHGQTARKRRFLWDTLRAAQISPQVHYIPVYRQPVYQSWFKGQESKFPNAEEFYDSCLSLPLFPKMSDADVQRVVHAIRHADHELGVD